MSYTYVLPRSTSFSVKGLVGYTFGPLRQKDLDIYYIESTKGHDTFMISRKITRTYYVLSGVGFFTISNCKYDVCPGMLVEVPPTVEYSYSGKMTLLAVARPRWFSGNDTHTRWNPDVVPEDSPCSVGREPWSTRVFGVTVFGRSPVGAVAGLSRRLLKYLPRNVTRFATALGPAPAAPSSDATESLAGLPRSDCSQQEESGAETARSTSVEPLRRQA